MKKATFLFFILFCNITVFCQKYVPFPTENAEWNVMYSSYSEGTGHKTVSITNYSLRGDTLVDGVKYKKVCVKSGSPEQPTYFLTGLIREQNKKVFYIGNSYGGPMYISGRQQIKKVNECNFSESTQSEVEILLYDFNVKVGDNVQLGFYRCTIQSIDSIKIGDSYRKRYNTGYDEYVEGIGSIKKGLLGTLIQIPTCGGGMSWEHVCFSQNGETVYRNPAYRDCNSTQKWSDKNYLVKNTQWYYGETIFPFYTPTIKIDDYNSLKSLGDTLINGKNCNIIRHVRNTPTCYGYHPTVYIYQSNDTVFFYNTTTKKFSSLYVYAANKGDSWIVEYPAGIVKVNVDSISFINAFWETLKVQHVRYCYNDSPNGKMTFEYTSKIIEGIGDENYLFKSNIFYLAFCDEFSVQHVGLRCYVHPDLGTFKIGTVACDYVTEVTNPTSKTIKVFITSSGDLTIEGDIFAEPCTFELMDVRGCILLQTEVNATKNSIHFSNYSKGLYMYQLTNNGRLLKIGKIVKI